MNHWILSGYLDLTELYQTDAILHFALNGMIDPNGQNGRRLQSEPCGIRLDCQHIFNGYYALPTQVTVNLYAQTKDGIVWLHDEPTELTRTEEGGLYFDAEAFLARVLGQEVEQTLDEREWHYQKKHDGELRCGSTTVTSELGVGLCKYGTMILLLVPDALRIGETCVNRIDWQSDTLYASERSAEQVMNELLSGSHHLNHADMERASERLAKAKLGVRWGIQLFTERRSFKLSSYHSCGSSGALTIDIVGNPEAFQNGRWILRNVEVKEALLLMLAGVNSDERIRGKLAKLALLGLASRQ